MMDITKQLEKTLSEKVIILSDIQDLKLEDNSSLLDSLNMLCEKKAAYRLGVDGYIGYQFLWNFILDKIKMEKGTRDLDIEGRPFTPNIVAKMLASMEAEGLIKKEGSVYRAVLDKILSKEIILNFCWGRADVIKIEDILRYYRFASFATGERDLAWRSPAFNHCRKIMDQLSSDGMLQKNETSCNETNCSDLYSWIDI